MSCDFSKRKERDRVGEHSQVKTVCRWMKRTREGRRNRWQGRGWPWMEGRFLKKGWPWSREGRSDERGSEESARSASLAQSLSAVWLFEMPD